MMRVNVPFPLVCWSVFATAYFFGDAAHVLAIAAGLAR